MIIVIEFNCEADELDSFFEEDKKILTEPESKMLIKSLAETLKHAADRGVTHNKFNFKNISFKKPENGGQLILINFSLNETEFEKTLSKHMGQGTYQIHGQIRNNYILRQKYLRMKKKMQ